MQIFAYLENKLKLENMHAATLSSKIEDATIFLEHEVLL